VLSEAGPAPADWAALATNTRRDTAAIFTVHAATRARADAHPNLVDNMDRRPGLAYPGLTASSAVGRPGGARAPAGAAAPRDQGRHQQPTTPMARSAKREGDQADAARAVSKVRTARKSATALMKLSPVQHDDQSIDASPGPRRADPRHRHGFS
jgi:hypothetical protein